MKKKQNWWKQINESAFNIKFSENQFIIKWTSDTRGSGKIVFFYIKFCTNFLSHVYIYQIYDENIRKKPGHLFHQLFALAEKQSLFITGNGLYVYGVLFSYWLTAWRRTTVLSYLSSDFQRQTSSSNRF